ncbi:MAG: CoA transferase [Xanthobacteraceae bacterium]|jgi:crotonobetainyl-CoA:carnitine CoA-transferase CaiB-like acyl-CoA transferase
MQLAGLRVLDFCWIGAGAFVTRILADLGAEVIKVESRTHPDNLRLSGPHQPGAKPLEGSGYFASRNTSKKSIALNMSHPRARQIALTLASRCSVVSNNFRPGVMEKWGLGYGEVAAVNPSVIYLAMPMQGSSGPNRDYIGFGSTIAALCGLVSMAGRPGRPPLGTGTHYPDHVPNPGHALVAVLAAAFHRARTGEGQQIELAQIESTVNMLGPSVLACAATGVLPQTNGNRRAGAVPRGVFPCAGEDVWCAIEANDDRDWQGLVDALGAPEWMRDDELKTLPGREARQDAIETRLAQETGRYSAAELVARLQAHGVAAAKVATSADVTSDPQLLARRYWHHVPHAEMGSVLVNLPPFRAVGEERVAPGPPPLLGEHTFEVASELLGFDETECRRLMDEKVFY